MTGQHRRRVCWGLALAAAVAAAAVGILQGVHGWPDATTHLRDDAFYEFTWACNVARARGPVVSDGATTSGVSLLWSGLLAWLGGGQPGATQSIAVVLGVGCHLLGALGWVLAGGGRPGAWCVGLLWLGNPLALRECQNGQETALAALLLACLWHARRARERSFAILGMLLVLARSDLWVFVAMLSLTRHGPRPWRGLPTPLLLLAMHLGANRLLGGGWVQDSALPMAWLAHAAFAATDPTPVEWLRQHWWYLRPALLGGPFDLVCPGGFGLLLVWLLRPVCPQRWRWLPLLLVGGALGLGAADLWTPAIAAVLLALRPAPGRRPVPWGLLALMLGSLAVVALHWAVRWYPRDYYLVPLLVAAAAGLQRARRSAALLLLAAAAQLALSPAVRLEPLQGQTLMELAGRHLGRLLPAGERVGCFNSGLLGFHGGPASDGPLRVVNLDGVVDARAFAALQAGALAAWLDREQVRFLVDNPRQFERVPGELHACGAWFGSGFDAGKDLLEVARFVAVTLPPAAPVPGFHCYWRVGRGEAPARLAAAVDLGPAQAGGRCVLWPAAAGAALELEGADGGRTVLHTAPVATTVVLQIRGELGTGRLFERGRTAPLLQLVPDPR